MMSASSFMRDLRLQLRSFWMSLRELARHAGGITAMELAIVIAAAWAAPRMSFPHPPDFLGTIVTFETTGVAIIVPLSLDVAFRVHETYKSRAVREHLFRDPQLTRLVLVTIVTTMAAVVAHAAFSAMPEEVVVWKGLSAFSFANSFVVAFLLLAYLLRLRHRIVTEPDWILERMKDEAIRELEDDA